MPTVPPIAADTVLVSRRAAGSGVAGRSASTELALRRAVAGPRADETILLRRRNTPETEICRDGWMNNEIRSWGALIITAVQRFARADG
jgi:hypothetical protein